MEPQVWREASLTYPDFVGTAELDHRMTGDSGFKLAGIDEEKWHVIGFDIGGGELGHQVRVVAIEKESIPEGDGNIIARLMKEHGHLPVHELLLHDVDPYEFLKNISHQFELRMRASYTVDKDIVVTTLGDIPEQS